MDRPKHQTPCLRQLGTFSTSRFLLPSHPLPTSTTNTKTTKSRCTTARQDRTRRRPRDPSIWHEATLVDHALCGSLVLVSVLTPGGSCLKLEGKHSQTSDRLVLAASQLEPTAANDSTNVDPVPTIGPSMRRILFQMIFTTDDHLIGQLPLPKPGATPFLARRQSTQVIRQGEEGKAKRTRRGLETDPPG